MIASRSVAAVLASALTVGGLSACAGPLFTPPVVAATMPTAPASDNGAVHPSPSAAPAPVTKAPAGSWWAPKQRSSFQVQYYGPIDLSLPVDVYNLDWESTTAAQVLQLKSRGVRVICYLNAGAFEEWRKDKDRFPQSVIGEEVDGWDGEYWLDINRTSVLLPIMEARMDVCAAKGFDAVDPDNTDGYLQRTGFAISPTTQVAYQTALARSAHRRGLGIGLKNNPGQLAQLGAVVDFAVNEQCVEYAECYLYSPFLASGKAVFNIEYEAELAEVCPGRPAGMTTVVKDRNLTAALASC